MWIIQDQYLVRVPDDVQVPPGSVPVELPDDFLEQPEAYKIEGERIVKKNEKELKAVRQRSKAVALTQDDIVRIKRAIENGRL